ncbi:unannotated protein [freshwater metagenome]|uniref:Unannotated protein n=1 Tax=freshwater metagenome TaxID=449393 RepID=A0A6J7DC55_9ZZZZ
MGRNPLDLVNQVGAARKIAPLIASTGLQNATVLAVQLEEVESLQYLVRELGIRDTCFRVQSRADRVFLEHRPDSEVLPNLTQEIDCGHRLSPVEVVDETSGVLPRKVKKLRDLRTEVADPLSDGFPVVEGSFCGWLGVTDEAGRSADEAQRVVPLELDATQQQELNKVSEVEAWRRRVKPAVIRDGRALEQFLQFVGIGRYVNQPTPLQFVPQGRKGRVIGLALERGGVGHDNPFRAAATAAVSAVNCSETRIGAVPPRPVRDATELSIVRTLRTSAVRFFEIDA